MARGLLVALLLVATTILSFAPAAGYGKGFFKPCPTTGPAVDHGRYLIIVTGHYRALPSTVRLREPALTPWRVRPGAYALAHAWYYLAVPYAYAVLSRRS
jgi:hypothetical protein